eukprot:2375-Heterococcus_DN1.PRE.1
MLDVMLTQCVLLKLVQFDNVSISSNRLCRPQYCSTRNCLCTCQFCNHYRPYVTDSAAARLPSYYYYRHALRSWRVHTKEAAAAARSAMRVRIVYKRCMLHWKWFAAAEVARKQHCVALLGTVLQRNRQQWSLEQAFT